MPHQCVRCGTIYPDDAEEILKGCSKCGGKLFFYIRKEQLEKKEEVIHLTEKEKKEIEQEVFNLIGVKEEPDKPVILDIESIRVKKPGKYEIDLVKLFKESPIIFRIGDGKYIIDLAETFKVVGKKNDTNS
ncbi:hypothetical protein J7K74_00925 [Candidatus Woesearchaeota archaeon]|nr:hypothetical protein [Candidatus Woesearchaeota archaeon]